jgi:alcohol dehydrogenase class IV
VASASGSVASASGSVATASDSVATASGAAAHAAQGLYDLAHNLGAPMSLKEIGMKEADLDRAAQIATQAPYPNPRTVEYAGIRRLLDAAYHGRRPE